MKSRVVVSLSSLLVVQGLLASPASAGQSAPDVQSINNGNGEIGVEITQTRDAIPAKKPRKGASSAPALKTDYLPVCDDLRFAASPRIDSSKQCAPVPCPEDPEKVQMAKVREVSAENKRDWGLQGEWYSLADFVCIDPADQPGLAGAVYRAFRSVVLPEPTMHIEPKDRTLVNLDTIFYAEPWGENGTKDISLGKLLGADVVLRLTADSYTWHFGDGSDPLTTDGPGGPYPNKDVTHTYRELGTFITWVEMTYTATYSVDGGEFRPVPGTVTRRSADAGIEVVEARSQLVAGDR